MFNTYPYTDTHELNLDWIIKKMRELDIQFDEFKVINTITFSGAWDITKQYPAWTIVSDNNLGYVSIKPVPAGVVLTNTEYWRLVIDYTAQIAGLQARVVDCENDILALQGDMTTAQSNISTLQTTVNRLDNRLFLFLGDSYYLGGTGITYTGIGWASQVIDFMGLDSDHYILTPADDVINPDLTVSLPGFYPSAGSHRSFKTILEASAARLTAAQKLAVTDVVVAGGYNDINQGAQIDVGEQEYATYAKATFPNARLWCAHIAYSTKTLDRTNLIDTRIRYRDVVKYGMTYISDAEFVLTQDSLLDAGGVHPVEAGYKQIGQAIANALLGGGNCYSPSGTYTTSAFTYYTLYSGSMACNFSQYGIKTVVFSTLIGTIPNPVTVTSNNPLRVYITNDSMQPTGTFSVEAYVDLHEQGGSDHWEHCILTFGQDDTYGKYFELTPIDTSFNYIINSFNIPKMAFNLPSNIM